MNKLAVPVMILGLVLSLAAVQEDVSAPDPRYTSLSFARLSFLTGDVFIQKAADLAYVEGEINMPVVEGDRVGTTEGRAEIYLGRGAYLRLNNRTKIDMLILPREEEDLIRIRVWSGNVIFSLDRLDEEKSIEIHTSDMSVYLLDQGVYRLDVRENAATELYVFHGIAEAAGEDESHMVKDAQRLEAVNGKFIDPPLGFAATEEDSFDQWSDYRDSGLRTMGEERRLPDELEDFEGELAEAGDWAYEPSYGNVWIPRGVTPGWRPYLHGRWLWYNACGWTWLPYEPWGWVTFHFGRWHWGASLGWHWIPTRRWGPGWVSWYTWGDYLGWAPMSYYGHPGVIINNIYHPRYTGSYHPYNSRSITVINKRQLQARDVSRVALGSDKLRSLGRLSQTKTAPMERPRSARISTQELGDRKVFLHNSERNAPYRKPESVPAAKVRGRDISGALVPSRRPKAAGDSPGRVGYPSSPEITRGVRSKTVSTRSGTRSPVSRFYDSITGSGSRVTRQRISGGIPRDPGSKSGVRTGGTRITRPPAMRSPSRSPASRSKTAVRRSPTKSRTPTTRKSRSGTRTKKKK